MKIRPRTRDDDPVLMDIYNQYEEIFKLSLDEWRFHMDERARERGKEPIMMVGEIDGQIVGDWYVEHHWGGAGGTFFAVVEVDQSKTRRGYGTTLWNDAEAELRRRGVRKVYHQITDNRKQSQEFAEHRGFKKTGRADRISRLELAKADLTGYEGVEERLASEGIEIRSVAEIQPLDESFMRRLHTMVESVVADIPRTEKKHQEQPFEVWSQNFLKSPGSSAEAYFLALDNGSPVGLANLHVRPGAPAFNGLTGVAREYRGRGVARALKLRTIRWARDKGIEHIDTGNDAENARMLAINVSLGYKALPAREEWLKEYAAE
jgi:GNAT superfamily N-acetyltransferase